MNITMLHDGTLVALFRSRWADNIYISHSVDNGESQSAPQAAELPSDNSSIQVTTLASGKLALVYSTMSAAGAVERRTLLCSEIVDGGDSRKEPTAVERSALWGAPRTPVTAAISTDGGES